MDTLRRTHSTRLKRAVRSSIRKPKPTAKAAQGRRREAALQKIQDRLEVIRSSVVVVARALREQNCEIDDDAARVLVRHVTDGLAEQMGQIGLLIRGVAS
jgi:hypothetical protein